MNAISYLAAVVIVVALALVVWFAANSVALVAVTGAYMAGLFVVARRSGRRG